MEVTNNSTKIEINDNINTCDNKRTAQGILDQVSENIARIEQEINPVQLLTHSKYGSLFSDILKIIKPIDFDKIANNPKGKKASLIQQCVICISELQKLAEENNRTIKIVCGIIYIYNGIYWQSLNVDETTYFLGEVAEAIGIDPLSAKFYVQKERLMKQLRASAYAKEEECSDKVSYINFPNCTLHITADGIKKEKHRAEDNLNYCLSFNYDPEASCPKFNKYFKRVQPDIQCQNVIFEFLGYVFTKGLKLEKILFLYGDGKNGKSVLYDIIQKLIGEENITHYSLDEVTNDKGYCRINLLNKLLNYGSDINDRLDPSNFKKMASGEPILARAIHSAPVTMKHYAKQMHNTNVLPGKNAELSEGFKRRSIFIPFSETISDEEKNPNLAKEIISNELSGIFNLVIDGLERLLKQRDFSKCIASEILLDEFFNDLNPIDEFLTENSYTPSPDRRIPLISLYSDFCTYCYMHHIPFDKIGRNIFSAQLRKKGYCIKNIGGKARQVFIMKND